MTQRPLNTWTGQKMPKLDKDKLGNFLWAAADMLRGAIDSSEYRHYIFGLLFLKRLSDQFDEERKKVKGDLEDPDNYQFFVPKRARWKNIRKVSEGIGNAIDKAFGELEENNLELLEKVLTRIQFEDTDKLPDKTLSKLILHFSQPEFNLSNSNLAEPDILGRAYEYLIQQFADDAGKKGGEFYTPEGVVRLLVHILDPEERMKICDPACGSGGMLVESINYMKEHDKNEDNVAIFGQEKNLNTWAIAKMNLLLHNVLHGRIERGDTMENPKLLEGSHLMKFDIVIANPMWNQKEWSRELFESGDPYGRVLYGVPPKSSGDWMWVQHMLTTLNKTGRLGIVLDNGTLFRGNREGKIRKAVVEADLIEGVVALPPNLFYNTGAPGCLIIINKNKAKHLDKKIFFIHAENEYEEGKAQNFLRYEHIEKIVNGYRNKEEIGKFSALIDLEEIKVNDYNLYVSRYIDILPEEEPIDVIECIKELRKLQEERAASETEFETNMRELGYY